MGKSDIKPLIFRRYFANCARAVPKDASQGKLTVVPRREPTDNTQTLANVTYVVEDAGIKLHAYSNVEPVDRNNEDGGFRVRGERGDALAAYVMSSVRGWFGVHPQVDTYILVMDKGCFMPKPKTYVQAMRTQSLVQSMEDKGIMPIEAPFVGKLPTIISPSQFLPPWIAVRANRTIYRHATCELFDLIASTYRPPPGRRLILDCLDTAATSPPDVEHWMCSERLICDDVAINAIEEARLALFEMEKRGEDWRNAARKIVAILGHGGHIESVPICIYTTEAGVTHPPFLLPNAANTCGEADVGIQFWLTAMQTDRRHVTLRGKCFAAKREQLDNTDGFYTDEQIAEHDAAMAAEEELVDNESLHPDPLIKQREWAARFIAEIEEPSIFAQQIAVADMQVNPELQRAKKLYFRTTAENPCRQPNRGFVISTDSDFFSLLMLWYAQFVADSELNGQSRQYCIDNAPLLCLGMCDVFRTGWLTTNSDHYVAPKKKKGAPPPPPPAEPRTICHEVFDIAKLVEKLHMLLDEVSADDDDASDAANTIGPEYYMARVASFAAFCGSCENDFLGGLCNVNFNQMFDAFLLLRGKLAQYGGAQPRQRIAVILPDRFVVFIKHCYHNSLDAKCRDPGPTKPSKAPQESSYMELAAIASVKYKAPKSLKNRMPDKDRLLLMYERLQWWIVYAMRAHASITELLDETIWGWRAGTTDVKV